MITVNVPPNSGMTDFHAPGGRVYQPRLQEGRLVMDVEPIHFRSLLRSETIGQQWVLANPEVMHALAVQEMAVNQPR